MLTITWQGTDYEFTLEQLDANEQMPDAQIKDILERQLPEANLSTWVVHKTGGNIIVAPSGVYG